MQIRRNTITSVNTRKLQLSDAIVSDRVLCDPHAPFEPEEEDDARKLRGHATAEQESVLGCVWGRFKESDGKEEDDSDGVVKSGSAEWLRVEFRERDLGDAALHGLPAAQSFHAGGSAPLGTIDPRHRRLVRHAVLDSAARSQPRKSGFPPFPVQKQRPHDGLLGPGRNYLPPAPPGTEYFEVGTPLVSEEGVVSEAAEVDVVEELRRLEAVVEKEAVERKIEKAEGERRGSGGKRRGGPNMPDAMVEEEERGEETVEEDEEEPEAEGEGEVVDGSNKSPENMSVPSEGRLENQEIVRSFASDTEQEPSVEKGWAAPVPPGGDIIAVEDAANDATNADLASEVSPSHDLSTGDDEALGDQEVAQDAAGFVVDGIVAPVETISQVADVSAISNTEGVGVENVIQDRVAPSDDVAEDIDVEGIVVIVDFRQIYAFMLMGNSRKRHQSTRKQPPACKN
ncbi:hypothetical protein BJ742DRAFT_873302 [Cladochytrium replicatum]|nr:hypothetical protein BJ742DRAFT_873302 [Cladochytrium replicatum]